MEEPVKGTVTPLASLFSEEEAQKAAKHVQDAIIEKQKELDRLRGFVDDNSILINLVQRLPDELHHDIMVPFGKAAFFPGRLIHTNECLVLLGEGYYADRTSKQTIEILKRRGKALESQVDSLKAMMQDLKAEASFFDTTASEVAEGLVEIREDYLEENRTERVPEPASFSDPMKSGLPISEADKGEDAGGDEEFACIMSKLEELEKEEMEAESVIESDKDELTNADVDQSSDQGSTVHYARDLEEQLKKPPKQSNSGSMFRKGFLNKEYRQRDCTDQINLKGLTGQSVSKGEMPSGQSSPHEVSKLSEKALIVPEVKENVQASPSSRNEVSDQSSKPTTDSLKAFTGCIVEHTDNIQMNPREQAVNSSQASSVQTSKPVSRFKMQRR